MTAVGQYITREGAKLRLFNAGFSDASNNALIDSIVAQVNGLIESKTHRAICPIPAYASTFSASAGDQTVTVANISGLNLQDDVLLGLVSGDHEDARVMAISTSLDAAAWQAGHAYSTGDEVQPTTPNGHAYRVVSEDGTSDATEPASWPTDGTVVVDNDLTWLDEGAAGAASVTFDRPLANAYASAPIQRIYVHDGFEALDIGRTLIVSRGVFALATLEVTTFTRGPFSVIPPADYFLEPSILQRDPGWPATELRMTNIPTPGNATPAFYPGFRTVRLIGPGPCVGLTSAPGFGWPAYMPEIGDIAAKLFVSIFRERASSGGASYTVNLDGSRVYERALSWEDKATLDRFRSKDLTTVDAGMYGWM